MRDTGEQASDEGLEPLKLQRYRARPSTLAVTAQTLITLVVIFGASQLFVQQLEWAGPALGLPSAVVALLLSPIATELPEIMNAIIWVRQGKLQLALANISGAMMIQATVPSGIGILLHLLDVRHPAGPGRRRDDGLGALPALGPARGPADRRPAGRGGRVLPRLRRRPGRHALSRGPGAVRLGPRCSPGLGPVAARAGSMARSGSVRGAVGPAPCRSGSSAWRAASGCAVGPRSGDDGESAVDVIPELS